MADRDHCTGCLIVIAAIVAVAFLVLWLTRHAAGEPANACPTVGRRAGRRAVSHLPPRESARREHLSKRPPAGVVVRMRVTAYCPCRICCGRWADVPMQKRRLAGGRRLLPLIRAGRGFVAADPKAPFGTRVIVPGYAAGAAVPILDRGGKIRGRKLDVFFPTHSEARRWGAPHLDVIVLPGKPGKGG
ncbi:MAG TPA: 3D domain-containing protein [Phycisphaerae bacterium]|nr:3D domain-containing protein [Phycisphaerae bacterium]